MISRPARIGAALAGLGLIGATGLRADPDGWTLTGSVSQELRGLTNPDLDPGGEDDATARATTRLTATLTRESPTSTLSLTGGLNPVLAEADEMPDSALGILAPSLGGRLLVEGRRSRVTASLRGSLVPTAFTDTLFGFDDEGNPDLTDPTLITGDAIRATLSAAAGISWDATRRDAFSLGVDATRIDFFDGIVALVPTTSLGTTGSWTRALTPTLDGVLTADLTWFQADSDAATRSLSVALTGGVAWAVNESLELSAGAGLTATRSSERVPPGPGNPRDSDFRLGFTGNVDLSWTGQDDRFTLFLSQGVLPSTLGSLQNTTAFGARYDHAINSVSSLGFETRAQLQSALSGADGDTLALRFSPYYAYQLDAETSLRLGYAFEYSDRDGVGTTSSHAVFLTLTRDFTLLQ
jgi:hypothetical protein